MARYTPLQLVEGGYTGITLSVRLSVCPSVRLSVCPPVCLSVRLSGFVRTFSHMTSLISALEQRVGISLSLDTFKITRESRSY